MLIARRVGVALLILAPLVAIAWAAIAGRGIESRVLWGNTTPADAYKAALEYVRSAPAMRGATNFSKQKDSVVERWGPTRWRVAGYVDTQPTPGAKVHTFYSCVLHYSGQARWEVEDLHFERIE